MAVGTERVITVPLAWQHQAEVLLSPARHKIVACGRRWGKTATALMATVRGHGPHKAALPGASDGAAILWVAPTYAIIRREPWPLVKKACQGAWTEKSEIDHTIWLPGGGKIVMGSTDNPTSLLGSGWDGIVFDEAAMAMHDGRVWFDALRPALTDRQGWSLKISTPNGFNWFKRQFDMAETEDGWQRWQRPSTDSPLVTEDEMDKALLEMGSRIFAQQHSAQFTDVENAEFDGSYFGDHIWFEDWPNHGVRFKVCSCDPSMGETDKSDFSAFAKVMYTTDGIYYVDANIARRDAQQIVNEAIGLYRSFRPDGFAFETNGFQKLLAKMFYADAHAAGVKVPLYGINNVLKKRERIRATLTPRLSRGEIRFKRNSQGAKMLVEQLRGFPVPSVHDDGPEALEMAIRLVHRLMEPTCDDGLGNRLPVGMD